MNVLLTGTVVAAAVTAMVGLVSVVLVHRLTERRENRIDRRTVHRQAASELTKALQGLRRVVVLSAKQPVPPQRITKAVASWETAYRKHETRIPQQGRHVRQSVAIALGEHFGAVGWSNILPEDVDFTVSDHDPQWWDNADSYLSYLVNQFSRWHDDPHAAYQLSILGFDTWLANRNRLF
ncbi:hypothetical protein [Kocuria rosea]|uniref:hypothetical protein n=1 Tax=Kocuria rosea TaxID=1275 RepID=UPI0025400C00|nr:hypothetical protein [Kocuria rosea]WIG18385.1 hypothetical protein QOY29_05505 [Kocuria rosea]